MSIGAAPLILQPLALTCTTSDCENDLHCFLQKTRNIGSHGGPCRSCGKDLVDFKRVQVRDSSDLSYTFNSLSREWIRHAFWHRQFDLPAINHARRKGLRGMRAAAGQRIRQSIGKAQNAREGRQTPYDGNVLYYAQHAVAACCRKCVAYWHGIVAGAPLTEDEVNYLANLVVLYVETRMPDLDEEPVKVPPIRRLHTEDETNG
jgi:Domain of unknown function (DUF4186)